MVGGIDRFEIDLIVWKRRLKVSPIIRSSSFEIDLIVWKPSL